MLLPNAATHLENEELHGLGVVLAVGEGSDLLVGVLKEGLEVLVALAEHLETRLVEGSRLGAARRRMCEFGSFHRYAAAAGLHLPPDLGLLALLLVLRVY